MPVGVLCALRGPGEELVLRAVDQSAGRLMVTRRCTDLAEVLAAADAGVGRLAVVSVHLELLDREAVHALHAAGTLVVGLVDPERPWLGDRLRAAGADHVAPAPVDDEGAQALVERLVELSQGVTPAVRSEEPRRVVTPRERGSVVAVWGPTGAPGRTTVAVNVAAELAAAGQSTLLVDADTYGGSVAQVVGMLDEAPGLAAAARSAGQGTLDLVALARLTPQIAPDLRVLSGIARADRWPEFPSSSLDAVWLVARSLAAWTVVDCGFCLESDEALSYDTRAPRRNAATLSALQAADVVVVVGAADPVGIQRLVRGLGELGDLALPARRLVVVNRVRASVAGPRPEEAVARALQRYAGVRDAVLVPDDRAAVDSALLEARALHEIAPSSGARRALLRLVRQLTALPAGAVAEGAEHAGAARR